MGRRLEHNESLTYRIPEAAPALSFPTGLMSVGTAPRITLRYVNINDDVLMTVKRVTDARARALAARSSSPSASAIFM